MDSRTTIAALRIIAETIDTDESPSISSIRADLEYIVGALEGENGLRTAGVGDFLKKMKGKLFKSKGEKKINEKIKRLETLKKLCSVIAKRVRKGEDLVDIASEGENLSVFDGASKWMDGGSEVLNKMSDEDADIYAGLEELDKHWLEDEEDDEEEDREVIVNALSEFHDKCEDAIEANQKKLERQKSKQGEEKLPMSKSKKQKEEQKQKEEVTQVTKPKAKKKTD